MEVEKIMGKKEDIEKVYGSAAYDVGEQIKNELVKIGYSPSDDGKWDIGDNQYFGFGGSLYFFDGDHHMIGNLGIDLRPDANRHLTTILIKNASALKGQYYVIVNDATGLYVESLEDSKEIPLFIVIAARVMVTSGYKFKHPDRFFDSFPDAREYINVMFQNNEAAAFLFDDSINEEIARLQREAEERKRREEEERKREEQRINDFIQTIKRYTEELQNNPNNEQKIKPKLALAHYEFGMMYKEQGKNDMALAEFEKALNLEPANNTYRDCIALYYYNRGYKEQKEHKAAIKDLNEALKLDPANSLYLKAIEEVKKDKKQGFILLMIVGGIIGAIIGLIIGAIGGAALKGSVIGLIVGIIIGFLGGLIANRTLPKESKE